MKEVSVKELITNQSSIKQLYNQNTLKRFKTILNN